MPIVNGRQCFLTVSSQACFHLVYSAHFLHSLCIISSFLPAPFWKILNEIGTCFTRSLSSAFYFRKQVPLFRQQENRFVWNRLTSVANVRVCFSEPAILDANQRNSHFMVGSLQYLATSTFIMINWSSSLLVTVQVVLFGMEQTFYKQQWILFCVLINLASAISALGRHTRTAVRQTNSESENLLLQMLTHMPLSSYWLICVNKWINSAHPAMLRLLSLRNFLCSV